MTLTPPGRKKEDKPFLTPSNLGFKGKMKTSKETSISFQDHQTITWFSVSFRGTQLSWTSFRTFCGRKNISLKLYAMSSINQLEEALSYQNKLRETKHRNQAQLYIYFPKSWSLSHCSPALFLSGIAWKRQKTKQSLLIFVPQVKLT